MLTYSTELEVKYSRPERVMPACLLGWFDSSVKTESLLTLHDLAQLVR